MVSFDSSRPEFTPYGFTCESRLLRFAEDLPKEAGSRSITKADQVMIETGGLNHVEQMALLIAQHYNPIYPPPVRLGQA